MDLKNKRIALVGGAGLIGSHLADLLLQDDVKEILIYDNFVRGKRENLAEAMKDRRIRIVEGDILDKKRLEDSLQGCDGVFLLAALWLLECAKDPVAANRVNVDGNLNVVEVCRQLGTKRLVFSSSASVYGDAIVEPMPEDHPLNNRTFYGATKVALEQMLRSYHEMYQLPYVALRYFNVYGPRQDYKNAYVSVIMKVLDRIDGEQPPLIFGDGTQSYDFIYVKDVAQANIAAMKSQAVDDSFNVCTGIKTSINEVVQHLLQITGSSLKPEYRPAPQVFVTNRVGDPKKARRLLHFTPETSLQEGLAELVAWRAARIREEAVS